MEHIADGFKGERAIVLPYSIRNFQNNNELTKSLYITHIGYYPNAKNHFRKRSKGALEDILIYCETGKGTITIENEQFKLTENQILIIPANKSHSYESDTSKPWSIYWIHFKGTKASLYSPVKEKLISLNDLRTSNRLELFEEMYQNLEMGFYADNLEYSSICFKHFLSSIKYMDQFTRINSVNTSDLDTIPMSIIFMRDNLTNKLTLNQIAKHVGYSDSYFRNLFLEKTSFTPIEYLNKLKIQKSCSLLQFSNMKINEIAYHLGYYDPFHFSKSFRKEMELSPREYRKKYKN
ncbi:AraC-type DNA-binding protein [Flavobacterium gillisiae]|uniref:AraC-type DNA-binding protein n=1 Tax=Flavobacterium gillisiae TaxID=150146 RepID=A0A1H4F8D0_9FLAO|nr:AraC family transcriptional regulator [Flavobacterium gillisiae]SEA93573.1 AraC-type DNA-binding protein [Flavobacterium gillisiae]